MFHFNVQLVYMVGIYVYIYMYTYGEKNIVLVLVPRVDYDK